MYDVDTLQGFPPLRKVEKSKRNSISPCAHELFPLYLSCGVKRGLKCVILAANYVVTRTQELIDPHKDHQPVGLIGHLVEHFTSIADVRVQIPNKKCKKKKTCEDHTLQTSRVEFVDSEIHSS